MKKLIFLIFLMSACVKNDASNLIPSNIDFEKDYSFLEFKKLLDKYNEQSSFPELKN